MANVVKSGGAEGDKEGDGRIGGSNEESGEWVGEKEGNWRRKRRLGEKRLM